MRRIVISGMVAILPLLGSCVVDFEADPGWLWCIEATGANGTRTSSGGNVNITRGGDWVSGCWYYCEWQHTILEQGEEGEYDMMHPLYTQWQDLRNAMYDGAEDECEEQVDVLESGGAINFSGPGDVTCNTAVHTQLPTFWKKEDRIYKVDACDHIGNETGTGEGDSTASTTMTSGGSAPDDSGGDVGPDIYGLSSYSQVLSCSTNTSLKRITCNIDQEFIRYLADHDELLWLDDATMVEATVGTVHGWKFDTCGTGSLMYAAGFRQNDMISKVDATPVPDFEASILALGRFGSPLFGGSSVTGSFYRSSVVWTFVANRVNNPNYP